MSLRETVRRGAALAVVALALTALASCTTTGGRYSGTPPLVYKPAEDVQAPAAASSAAGAPSTPGEAAVPAEEEGASGPLEISAADALILALENNPALAVERLNPPRYSTFEEEEASEFDAAVAAEVLTGRQRIERFARASSGTESSVSDTNAGGVSVSQSLPSGTDVSLEASTSQTTSSLSDARLTSTRVGLSVTQALLRGFGAAVNLVSLRQARVDTLSSEYELRGFAEALVADVEKTYWDYALARREIDIVTESLKLAEQQLADTNERINIGQIAEIELAASEAEVALRHEALINAKSNLADKRLRLVQLLNPGGDMWDREILLTEEPAGPETVLENVKDHVALAMKMRPEVNQARLDIDHDDLELVRTRNGLLPRMDLFVTLGTTGYAQTFGPSAGGIDGQNYDISAGLAFEYPLGNRGARARHDRAVLDRRQSAEALTNLERLVELDVRSAYIEVNRAAEQVAATQATRKLQEETLRGETEKFRVGKSTTFLVAQAQRDLLSSQIDEVSAIVTYRKALVDLYRLDGSLLARRGVVAPGSGPPGELAETAQRR